MEDDFPEDFYKPPDELTGLVLTAGAERPTDDLEELPEPVIELARDDIRLRLYGSLAEVAFAHTVDVEQESCRLALKEVAPEIADEVRRSLVIQDRYEYVAHELVNDFIRWLHVERHDEYPARWGTVRLSEPYLAFVNVHLPRFLSDGYEKAESTRGDGRKNEKYEVA